MEQKTVDRIGFGIKSFGAVLAAVCAVLFAISIYNQVRHPKPGPMPPLPPGASASASASASAAASASASASIKKP